MKTMLYAGGVFHLAFALFHLGFWRLFDWREQLPRLGFVNRQVMQVLNLCLTFIFLAFAWVSFVHADALTNSNLGATLLAIIALFWLLRAVEQAWFFGLRNGASIGFFLVFTGGGALYGLPLVMSAS